jgi:DisA bacterial checkpoint controller nucleotide-binding
MINTDKLTDIPIEEAKDLAKRINFGDDLTPEEKFERLVAQHPLPSFKQISALFEEVFWASQLTEEGRPCLPRLLYLPRQQIMRQAIHRLSEPIELTREALRKLTPIQGELGYLTWDCESNSAEITGVQGREGGDPCDFITAAPKNGALDISWACSRLIALRAGRIERLSNTILKDVNTALGTLMNIMNNFEIMHLGTTIQTIVDNGHGGAIWVLREGSPHDGIHIGHQVQPDERPVPIKREQRFPWLQSLGHLASVDGAVLINTRLQVLGFGSFIDISDTHQVTNISNENREEKLSSTQLGGGRHRSAMEFCVRFAPAAAIVVSEDGRISIMWAASPDAPYCSQVSLLAIISDTII